MKTGNTTAVLSAFSRWEINEMKTPNKSLHFKRFGNLKVLYSYNTIIAYKYLGSSNLYYRPYVEINHKGEKLNKTERGIYEYIIWDAQYHKNTTAQHLSKLFNYINNEVENNNREFNWVFDRVNNGFYNLMEDLE
jgi:hypothetical protein